MGVINLSVLVDKIKRKLINGGFITSSDKASKSKFGIVKIGNGLAVNSGVVSVESSGSSIELLVPGDYTDAVTAGSSYLRTATGKDLSQYKMLFISISGSTDLVSGTIACATDGLQMMGIVLNGNGAQSLVQFALAKSTGSEVYDSVYCSYGSGLGKWGNIYGLK